MRPRRASEVNAVPQLSLTIRPLPSEVAKPDQLRVWHLSSTAVATASITT